jgi:hypothetical protein
LTAQTAERQIRVLLERQRADAAAKDSEAWHWGNTGAVVRRAVMACEKILLPLPEGTTLRVYWQRVLPELAQLAERYRGDEDDPAGYGLGTVREVEEAIKVMAHDG